ncbi:MAG: aminotransferase class I/II-fold pyridoxal phosphate-dependent enzyme, partial [Opitutales bacterium]
MSDSYIQQLFAERIGGAQYGKSNAIYKFEKIKRAKKAASLAKPDVPLIDMGVGEPDEMAFPVVVEALQKAAAQAENRGYADNGGDSFKQAAARYMQTVFQVESVDWETEVIHSIGSKSAL